MLFSDAIFSNVSNLYSAEKAAFFMP
jgi:hypothetical protein